MCHNRYGNRGYGMRHEHFSRAFGPNREYKVPVNIVKNESNYELLVFAPDREKADFRISVKGHELTVSYELKKDEADSRNWIRHEFSKTSFERTFVIDQSVDTENIQAEYLNGILHLTLPIIPGAEKPSQEIRIS